MKPAQLLEHFDRISETPDAVARLRRFILDLAVRGKLVEQDPNDEPAEGLLKRIQAEKARLVKEGSARKEKSRAPLAADELPFPIPKGWQWSQLAEIGFISPRNNVDGAIPTSFVPMTLIPADYGIPHKHEIRPWSEIKTGYTHFAEGDVGLAKITPCFENGKSTVFRSLTGGIGAGTTELHIVRPLLVDADYVLLFLKCPYFIESGIPRMTGTAGQKRVSADYFAISPFPLPPPAEQHRIVAKVNELMALCDQLEAAKNEREARRDRLLAASLHRIGTAPAATDEAATASQSATPLRDAARFHLDHLPRLTTRPEHIKQLRQTILNLAVRGRLVPQDPNDEPISIALARNDESRKITSKQDRRADAENQMLLASEERWEVPQSWSWRGLADLALFIDYRGQTPTKVESGVRLITAKNVKQGFINFFPEEFLADEAYASWMSRGIPKDGDVLFTTEAPMGNAAVVHIPERFALAQRVINFRLYDALSPDFLVLQLLSEPFRAILDKTATGLTAKGIKAAKLKRLPVATPPLAEQHRIVAKVDELMALCGQLEAQLTATQTDSRRLREAVLHEALAPALEKAA